MNVGSLFSGIGGLELGLERAGMRTIWQAEVDPYASRVLAKHWPGIPNLGDVRNVDWDAVERPDLICGGYPCQPFSHAGDRNGTEDARHLWPFFASALRLLRPRWALLENVPGHLSLGFDTVLADLAGLGFDAEWSLVSACSVGAPHVRQRLFVVAYADGVSGRPGLRGSVARSFRPLQVFDRLEDSRAGWRARMADPSELYGGADGLASGLDRTRAVGNAVVPQVAEWIGRRIMTAHNDALPMPVNERQSDGSIAE